MKLIQFTLTAILISCCMAEAQLKESEQIEFRNRLSKRHTKIDTVSDALKKTEGFPKKAGMIDFANRGLIT